MTSSLQGAIDAINAIMLTVSGIRAVPNDPPDSISVFPFSVVYPGSGSWSFGTAGSTAGQVGERLGLIDIVIEVHVSRRDLPTAVSQALTFADSVPDALMIDPTLTGTVDTYGQLEFTFGPLNWSDVPTIGWRFTLTRVKFRELIT